MKKRMVSMALALVLVLSLLPAAAAAEVNGPTVSRNKNAQDYTRWAVPVKSYLYENPQGGLTRVEYINGQVVIENYDSGFGWLDTQTLTPELPRWGGFFAGADYNFLIFGQENPNENDDAEVIRVVKYSKDWQRLGQASFKGANTTVPFDAGSLRCDEYGGYLYIRTCHEMYRSSDGLNHQSNLTMAVRQSDMTVTDSFYGVMNTSYGYVSHSFNQYLLVDEDGFIVALDHGDAYPRGAVLMRYYQKAGQEKFRGASYSAWCSSDNIVEFAGNIGNNTTGASVGGLGETGQCYVMTYSYDEVSGSGGRYPYYHYVDKDSGKGRSVRLSDTPGVSTPVLAAAGLEGGYVLWNGKESYTVDNVLYCMPYAADGTPGEVQAATGALSDCKPIPYQGGVVWYVTDNSAPVFYFLKDNKLASVSSVMDSTAAAEALYRLGLFRGTGNNPDGSPNFDLNRAPNRAEGITMLVRLLGKEEEAQTGRWETPFTDVADWLEPYVGYAYANGLTTGTSDTTFGGNQTISASEYLTFVLRALGYESGTDFQWNSAWTLSDSIQLTKGQYPGTGHFTRGDVAEISYLALSAHLKGDARRLYEVMGLEQPYSEETFTKVFSPS